MAGIDIAPMGPLGPNGDAVPFAPLSSFQGETPETDAEASVTPDENAAFWEKQITTALIYERRWRAEGLHAEKLYFGPDEDQGEGTSDHIAANNQITDLHATVHANIDVLKPLIFSETPQPIVQRRFKGDGKAVDETDIMAAEAGQRLAQYILSTTPFDSAMEGVRDDWLIPGRGVARAMYRATFGEKPGIDPLTLQPKTETVKLSEEVCAVRWEWRRVVFCPAHAWDRMPWIAFEAPMTRSQIGRRFPEFAAAFAYNTKGLTGSKGISDSDREYRGVTSRNPGSGEPVPSPFDTATVWEIWNKDSREVIWWSPDCPRVILDKEPDPLQLEGFWPMPKPLLATTKGESLLPRPDVRYYEARAKEVDLATQKMRDILDVLAVAGLYPGSAAAEVAKLMSGKTALYPVTDWIALMEKGGTSNLIQWLPIEAMVAALNALSMMREAAKQAMFEASGVSDIMRAQGDPNETATAQNLKGKYAGMRLSSRQRRMAVYVRDMLRILVEIAVEHFDTEFIAEICGMDLPLTEAERAQMEAQHEAAEQAYNQAAQQHMMVEQANKTATDQGLEPPVPNLPPPPSPPDDPHIPKTSWEAVHARLQSAITRKISVQIETSSTILADEQADKEARIEFLSAFSTFVQEVMPLVGSGQFPMKTVKEILMFGVRGFPKARTLEGMIAELPDEMPPGIEKEDVAVQVARIRAAADLQIERMKEDHDKEMAAGQAVLGMAHKAVDVAQQADKTQADMTKHETTLQHQAALAAATPQPPAMG